MHNDDALPAATLDREGRAVVFRAWFVNKPLKLDKPRNFEFALQASPYKPLDPGHRLWRCGVSRNDCCYGSTAGSFIRAGASATTGPPTGVFSIWQRTPRRSAACGESGYDYIAASASSCSECGGTPGVSAVLARVGQRIGLGQDAAGPLAGVDGQAHAGVRRALRSIRVAGKRVQ